MAHVTLRLVWYKLGECYKTVADSYDRFLDWYAEFSWRRIDLLDMLFLGWLLAAFVVVGALNLYLRFFGLPKSRRAINGDVGRSPLAFVSLSRGETCQWFNAVLSWISLHYYGTPGVVDAWIRSLNEEARKHSDGVQIKFERAEVGSEPPRITRITTDPASKGDLSLHVGVEASKVKLVTSVIQNTPTNLKVTSCDVTLNKLKGQLHIHGSYSQDNIQATVAFVATPEVNILVTTRNYDTSVDTAEVERVIRQSLGRATTSIVLSSKGGPLTYNTPSSVYADHSNVTTRAPLSTGRTTPQESRLMVKVIKANGLGDKDFGSTNPFCVITMDSPNQSHTTSVVKNTVNPFWDEHFIFDFDESSKQIKFEVYDRERPSGDDFLGRATIAMDELRRLPSSRQIIPLIEKPRATTTTSGSVTVELLFVDSGEISTPLSGSSSTTDAISPRRRIETNTRITPGGAIVRTTTTTTEKPKNHRVEPFFNDVPCPVERPEGTTYQTDYSPYNNHGSHLEAHDAALSASPVSTLRRGVGSTGSPKLTVTRPDMMGMHEAGIQGEKPEEPETLNLTATVSIDTNKDKKKSSFANTLKKRFSRPKKRSQSADRAYSSSLKEGSLLKPPEHADSGTQARTAEDVDRVGLQEGTLRKARSQSFSSSLRKLFKKKKKEGASRESSISRGGASGQASREGSVSHPSPHLSYRDDLQDYTHDYSYSSSMPASASPLSHPH